LATACSQSFSAYDDHYPFIRMGIAAADLLDLDDYPHWQPTGRYTRQAEPQSLDKVGRVLLKSLPRIETRLESGH